MKIRFLRNPRAEEVGPGDEFVAGETYSLSSRSAERWIRRGAAEPVEAAAPDPAADAAEGGDEGAPKTKRRRRAKVAAEGGDEGAE